MKLANDEVADFLDRCDAAGIKDPVAYLKSKRVVVYDWLKGAFPYGILPTDVDGLVHLAGHHLILEFKREAVLLEGKIPKGQLRCHVAFQGTVFVIGVNSEEEPSCLMEIHSGSVRPIVATTRTQIRERCAAWSRWAEANPL